MVAAYSFRKLCEKSDIELREFVNKNMGFNRLCEGNYISTELNQTGNDVKVQVEYLSDDRKENVIDDTKQPIFPCPQCTLCFTTAEDLKV